MDETKKAIAKKMKCMDLAAQLGLILGVNPVWEEDEYVTYGLADDLIELSFDLDNGCWAIATDAGAGDYGLARLPKEAIALMAGMSETIEEESNDK